MQRGQKHKLWYYFRLFAPVCEAQKMGVVGTGPVQKFYFKFIGPANAKKTSFYGFIAVFLRHLSQNYDGKNMRTDTFRQQSLPLPEDLFR